MQNKFSLIIIMLLIANLTSAQATKIPFLGNKIQIVGQMASLTVTGIEDQSIYVNTDVEKTEIDYTLDGNLIKLDLKARNQNVELKIPSHIDVSCLPAQNITESYDMKDFSLIKLMELKGELEINADGYHIEMDQIQGPISVVTYGDILSRLANPDKNKMIHLDTYMGNIDLFVPENQMASLTCTTEKGSIHIDPILKENYNKKSKGTKIVLHSEGGEYVKVSSLIKDKIGDPTHPKFRDALIKILIEDQGKKRMDNQLRRELEDLGYKDFIDALPDVYQGWKYTQKHKDELDALIAKHGFPNKTMVGEKHAMSAVRQVIFQSGKGYMSKYKDQFIEHFGQNFYNIWARREDVN